MRGGTGLRGWSTVPITPRGTRSSSSTRRVSTTQQKKRREREVLHNGFNTIAGSPTESTQLKSRQLAAIAVILSLGILPLAPGGTAAPLGRYTERLAVYAAGSNALW